MRSSKSRQDSDPEAERYAASFACGSYIWYALELAVHGCCNGSRERLLNEAICDRRNVGRWSLQLI